MTDRQAFALAHPLDYAARTAHELDPYKRIRPHPRGLMMTILAVDR
jgi:hypothetical protein